MLAIERVFSWYLCGHYIFYESIVHLNSYIVTVFSTRGWPKMRESPQVKLLTGVLQPSTTLSYSYIHIYFPLTCRKIVKVTQLEG